MSGDVLPVSFYLKLYLLTVPVFFAIDMLWLGLVAVNFYQASLDHLLSEQVNWGAALAFYCMYIGGILYFAVLPALATGTIKKALVDGAFFGFITYATYDLTNLATLADWPLNVVIVDIAWGTVLCSWVALLSFLIGKQMYPGKSVSGRPDG